MRICCRLIDPREARDHRQDESSAIGELFSILSRIVIRPSRSIPVDTIPHNAIADLKAPLKACANRARERGNETATVNRIDRGREKCDRWKIHSHEAPRGLVTSYYDSRVRWIISLSRTMYRRSEGAIERARMRIANGVTTPSILVSISSRAWSEMLSRSLSERHRA